jgi:ribonuclease D
MTSGRDMSISLHRGDLPDGIDLGPVVAVDSETMGLQPGRDRLCVVQLSAGDGTAHLVQFAPGTYRAPNLSRLLTDPDRLKLFHYARFDLAVLRRYLEIDCRPVYCTKIASKLVRTYTDRHGLKDLVRELLAVDLDKSEQSSDWGADQLSDTQMRYAARDVLHLHALRARLDVMIEREGRGGLAQACFDFLPVRAALDAAGWADQDIFAH